VADPRSFSSLSLGQPWLDNLAQLEYREMTPIQALALPAMLAGRDVLGQAGTGTGKTAAFGLALLARVTPRSGRPGALVLCPTRELATQITDELRRLARPLPHTRILTLSGGTSVQRERASLEHGVDVVVGTPGRVLDHLQRKRLDLGAIKTLVLDEADRMLEMGFVETVGEIVRATRPDRQTLLFSATFPDAVRTLSTTYQRDAEQVVVPSEEVAARITQITYATGPSLRDRTEAVVRVLGHHRPDSAVIFCNQRETCDDVAMGLAAAGMHAVTLHGGMDQHDRNTVLLLLKNGSLRFVVATDVAARGLDIDDLGAVINVELPRDPDVLTHRIGRTGRAGRTGLAITLDHRGDPLPPPSTEPHELAPMVTIAIQGGRQDRLRKGDIVGALTNDMKIAGTDIGQIQLAERISFVAIARDAANRALEGLTAGKIKNRRFRAYRIQPPR